MFLTQREPERGRLTGNTGAGTTYTTTPTTLASQGGLLINIDSATGDIAQTASGWIEDEKYGFYGVEFATSTSAEFDSAVTRTGRLTLKLSTLDATGRARGLPIPANNYSTATVNLANSAKLIPVKASTKYRMRVFAKTNNVAASSASFDIYTIDSSGTSTYNGSSNGLTGTNDWTLLQREFTTAASAVWLGYAIFNGTAGKISDAWFDVNSMTLEEVVEPVADSLQATNKTASIQSFTAVGSTDNIDQSQLTFGTAVTVGATAGVNYLETQSFTATKSKLTGVYLYKKANTGTPTGNLKIDIRTDNAGEPTATILASYTMPLATYNALGVGEFLVNFPCNLTAGQKYHIYLSDTVTETGTNSFQLGINGGNPYTGGDNRYSITAGASWIVNGTADLYFKTLYYKPTTNFKASQNNTSISISADEDGFLEGAKIDLTTATFTIPDFIHRSWSGGTLAGNSYTGNDVNKFLTAYSANSVLWSVGGTTNIISPTSSTKTDGYVIRLQGANYKTITTSIVVGNTGGTNIAGLAYSFDGVNYTEFRQINDDTEGNTTVTSTIDVTGNSEIFISLYRVSGADLRVLDYSLSGTIDTSTIPTLYNYPTNKDVTEYYTTTLSAPTTSATYRATKWGFPAIEYSATEYQYLNIDTTATGSVVQFSEAGAIFTTVADGASLAISSTSNPLLWVRTNITANRIYASSNDYNAISDKDGSNKMSLIYQVVQP